LARILIWGFGKRSDQNLYNSGELTPTRKSTYDDWDLTFYKRNLTYKKHHILAVESNWGGFLVLDVIIDREMERLSMVSIYWHSQITHY